MRKSVLSVCVLASVVVLMGGLSVIGAPAKRAARAAAAPVVVDKGAEHIRSLTQSLRSIDPEAMKRAIDDMEKTWPERCPGDAARAALASFVAHKDELLQGLAQNKDEAVAEAEKTWQALRGAILANPLLDSDKLLAIRRRAGRNDLSPGFMNLNAHTNNDVRHNGWDNQIILLENLRGTPTVKTLYNPPDGKIVRDMDLDFDGRHIMFSSIGAHDRWGIFQMNADGSEPQQISPTDLPDVDFFDSCYLPDGRFISGSTASYQGLPCENGGQPMVNLYLLDPAAKSVRQVTFEQDSDWNPAVLNDGRVVYLRWEYTDIMHYYSRRLFSMNPDGTSQAVVYGTNSMFPPAFKFAKAIPGHPRKIIGIIGGHHDHAESGRMMIIDPGMGRSYPFRFTPTGKEWGPAGSFSDQKGAVLPAQATGCVQEIPGYGKDVVGNVCDGITQNLERDGKPRFTHPWPLSEKYFLVSMKRNNETPWGLYLVDIFDNMTLIAEAPDAALLQPILFQPRTKPPVIPDRVKLDSQTATVHVADIYAGPGLAGVPRGTVKNLRVFAYHYAYNHTGGHESCGVESSWDIKRILGTVPVEADGSANFTIPANTPIALQPLDGDGRALQLMRSWFVGMPGELVSCVGCHETQNSALPARRTLANAKPSKPPEPWYGPTRPFAFETEVYPVLQKSCAGCHDGSKQGRPNFKDAGVAYSTLHPYANRPGPESDTDLLKPMEYHATISPVIQILQKGHHGVQLGRESWERLYTWIDLNCPQRGAWSPGDYRGQKQEQRRKELAQRFANLTDDPEVEYKSFRELVFKRPPAAFVPPQAQAPAAPDTLTVDGFPLSAEQAQALQKAAGEQEKTIKLANGQELKFVRIPAGNFIMGSQEGYPDERPRAVVKIARPFWMSVTEVTNAQYAAFDSQHDTRYIDMHGKDHAVPGYIANHPNQPVARITWQEAQKFCAWLSQSAQVKAALPTEAQWEYAARAGTGTPFYYGTRDTDFGKFANLADRNLRFFQLSWNGGSAIQHRNPYPPEMNFPLHEERFQDKWFVVDYVGQCEANAWGLKDMVGNVSEWTRSSYRLYPYAEDDGRNNGDVAEKKVARGGSWSNRPKDAGSSMRYAYESWQQVFDVGFRVIIEE